MASLSVLRDRLQARLATISGLRAHDTIPDQIAVPAAVVGGPDVIEYDYVMARGADRYVIPMRIYVNRANERAAQDALDGYLAASGPTSVKAAIEADMTLGGAAQVCRVTGTKPGSYGVYNVGNVHYLGVEFLCEVIA